MTVTFKDVQRGTAELEDLKKAVFAFLDELVAKKQVNLTKRGAFLVSQKFEMPAQNADRFIQAYLNR